MSRQFWASSFRSKGPNANIQCMNDIQDWDNPPDKENTSTPTTPQVAEAAARYYAHLGKLPQRTSQNNKDADTLIELLKEWGVEAATSDETGRDIEEEEVERISSNLPTGKSSGPDRIPNEFYKTFSKLLAPLLTEAFNEMRTTGSLYSGFSDGYVATL